MDMSPREFSAFLEEERQYRTPEQIDDLMRRYNAANSLSGRLAGLLEPTEGRRRTTFFPASVPEGMSLFDAVRSGEAEFAVPQGIVDMVVGGVQGVENPGLAAQGRIPAADMETAALQTAGTAMLGGGAVAKPAGSLGANTLRVYHGGPQKLSASDVEMRPDPEGTPIGFSVTDNPDIAEYYRNMRGGGSISEFDIDLDKANIISESELYEFIDDLENKLDVDASYEQIQKGLLDAGIDAIEYPDPEFGIRVVNPNILAANASKSAGLLSVASDVSARGDQILNMLKSGRGSEVTDAMLDMGDSVKNTQLNQYLAANYDLPMDEASRLARAREMGFNVDDVQYHGTAPSMYSDDDFSPNITAFIPGVKGQLGAGVYVAPDVRKANKFASAGEVNRGDFDPNKAVPRGGSVLPVYIRSPNPASYGEMRNAQYGLENVSGFNDLSMRGTQALSDEGFTGVRTGNEENVFDPNNIRSTNARFDPRLSELENIMAANASPISGLLAQSGVSSEQAQRIEDYLYRTGLLQ